MCKGVLVCFGLPQTRKHECTDRASLEKCVEQTRPSVGFPPFRMVVLSIEHNIESLINRKASDRLACGGSMATIRQNALYHFTAKQSSPTLAAYENPPSPIHRLFQSALHA